MADQTQILKIKCPHCGWVRTITLNVRAGHTEVVAGPGDAMRDLAAKVKDLFKDRELEEVNAWIVLPACPNPPCGKPYEANLRTGATRK